MAGHQAEEVCHAVILIVELKSTKSNSCTDTSIDQIVHDIVEAHVDCILHLLVGPIDEMQWIQMGASVHFQK